MATAFARWSLVGLGTLLRGALPIGVAMLGAFFILCVINIGKRLLIVYSMYLCL
jgi:hypothetical protein